ncbi:MULTISPECIES: hypothetical protein [unclassified Streptomyces]|uniref:hypothetical protein n=1 Tax=unclassified Streptomyces TaxID=2593676 RepID=UPI001F049383|nr:MULTISPECIES: hypothetical protein [unclassified Streptomyces]MCH0566502.1 hypothetical protein [Streptomyces sp. MUM 2J]MCH0571920.1 hypothetical protein [Streptomyces sp. MUM 136J]
MTSSAVFSTVLTLVTLRRKMIFSRWAVADPAREVVAARISMTLLMALTQRRCSCSWRRCRTSDCG